MPRRARNYLPGFPWHVITRGNNRVRQTVFSPLAGFSCPVRPYAARLVYVTIDNGNDYVTIFSA